MLFGCVITHVVAFGFCQDAKERRIAVRHPMPEGETANENGDAGEDGIEEIEGPYRANADEVKQRALHAQVGERLMQALEDPICALLLCLSSAINFSPNDCVLREGCRKRLGSALNAPEPTQDIDGENGNARSGGNPGERLLGARFAVGEAVAADHDRNQTGNLGNGAGEQALDGGKAGVER